MGSQLQFRNFDMIFIPGSCHIQQQNLGRKCGREKMIVLSVRGMQAPEIASAAPADMMARGSIWWTPS